MSSSISKNQTTHGFSLETKSLYLAISAIFLFIAALTIFQDFLESKRSGYSFHLSESLLFKTIWFLYIPILMALYQRLQKETISSVVKTVLFIIVPIVLHLLILPFVATFFSILFYEGRYDLFKFFSYTVANDFYKLVIVYVSFVLFYKYVTGKVQSTGIDESKPAFNSIVINNGKENVVVNSNDIIQITSSKPYISIHLQNKKYLHSDTLKSICQQLDGEIFVRVHKTAVINILKVSSFKSRLNGDYDLRLVNGDSVRLSRTYAADFKKRFDKGHQVSI